jgi:hypothetical protein
MVVLGGMEKRAQGQMYVALFLVARTDLYQVCPDQ